jgi:hypothetical protein
MRLSTRSRAVRHSRDKALLKEQHGGFRCCRQGERRSKTAIDNPVHRPKIALGRAAEDWYKPNETDAGKRVA